MNPPLQVPPRHRSTQVLFSSFAADGSEYASGDGDFDPEDDEDDVSDALRKTVEDEEGEEETTETPTIELQPPPLSKNAGNRFVAVVWDRVLQKDKSKDVLDLHYDRIRLTEDHVMFCRKQNLYNETFNTESMVDILWSLPMYVHVPFFNYAPADAILVSLCFLLCPHSLSSDLQRVIGHAMCLESTALHHVQDVLRRDPIIRMLLGDSTTDLSEILLFRWRHIRDYSLRIDDGRDGYPCMCLALDHEDSASLRRDTQAAYLETLIRSERVIAAGPLHVATERKDDPVSQEAVGDFILFNARHRDDAIAFGESLPTAQVGLYRSMRVHFYNTLDVTGKFVSEDPLRDAPGEQMKEAMEYWGYPVSDEQTPWLNR